MKLNLFPTNHKGMESAWWTRLIKVLIIVLTVAFAFIYYLNVVSPDMQRQPYYDYSFDPNFNSYSEPVINCGGVPGKCSGAQNSDSSGIVEAYQVSSSQRNEEVMAMMSQNPNITPDQILSSLENNGEITDSLQAKDINNVEEFIEHDWWTLIVYTVLIFLFLTQVVLRIIFYIIYGKNKM